MASFWANATSLEICQSLTTCLMPCATGSCHMRVPTLCGIASVAAMFTALGIAFAVYRAYAHDLKQPEQAIASSSVGTSLAYDRTGQTKLYEFVDPLGGLKEPKPLSEISPWLIAATIATEDDSFYENPGVNFRGLARAAVENLTPFGPGFLK